LGLSIVREEKCARCKNANSQEKSAHRHNLCLMFAGHCKSSNEIDGAVAIGSPAVLALRNQSSDQNSPVRKVCLFAWDTALTVWAIDIA
jgi:hypothetical protein